MNTPVQPAKSAMHPLLLIAAIAVILFCAVGTAAIMGWLPKSTANGDLPPAAAAQGDSLPGSPAGSSLAAQQQSGITQAAPMQLANAAPLREADRAPEPQAAPAVCKSCGVVESVRTIEHRPQGSGVGAAGGAILGGLLGNQVGGGHGRQLATVAGAVGGAVAGNQIEGSMKTTHSWQITVRMDNGTKRTFNHASQPSWREGDAVKVVNGSLRSAT
jgi:outer membrane lipoprotein SlyB